MIKRTIIAFAGLTVLGFTAAAYGQITQRDLDRANTFLSKTPETITCYSVTHEPSGDSTFEVMIFDRAFANIKARGVSPHASANSTVIYDNQSGPSAINLIVNLQERTIIAISGNLRQPNTCTVGARIS